MTAETKGYFAPLCEGFGKGALFDCVWAGMNLSLEKVKCEMADMQKRGVAGISTYHQLKTALETKLSNDIGLQTEVKKKFAKYMDDYMDPKMWKDPKKPFQL